MCITRVGRVLSTNNKKAVVEFFDGRTSEGIDLSVVSARKGAFIEVFGNVALTVLSTAEARRRKEAWKEIRKAAAADQAQRVAVMHD
jgi:hydrogenase maturation factor